MITGFNTDIAYEGVTYHVQTEDKGLATPLILSLVYDRGTILASKRSPYDDLLIGGFDEKLLIQRLQKQHKLICAAVGAGRIEDLKRMTMKESASRQKGLVTKGADRPAKEAAVSDSAQMKAEEIPMPLILKGKSESAAGIEKVSEEAVWDIPLEIVEEPAAEFVQAAGNELILPAEAVEILTDFVNAESVNDDSSTTAGKKISSKKIIF